MSDTYRRSECNALEPQIRRFCTTFAIGLSLLSTVNGCGTSNRAHLPGETFDAGVFFATSTPEVTHQFSVVNTTGRAVRILDETHSCNCTKVTLEKRQLPPGASMPLMLSVQVPHVYAKTDISCTLATDNINNPNWTYRLRFESYPDAEIDPDRIEILTDSASVHGRSEQLGDDASRQVWLVLYSPASEMSIPEPVSISASSELSVDLGRRDHVEALAGGMIRRVRYPLSVWLKEDFRHISGIFTRPLNISMSRGAGASALISWHIRMPIEFSPSQIHFGMVAPGGQKEVFALPPTLVLLPVRHCFASRPTN